MMPVCLHICWRTGWMTRRPMVWWSAIRHLTRACTRPPSARKIVAFVRLFTRGGVALQEPCMNRDTRAEWPALWHGMLQGRKPTDNEPFLRASPGERGQALRPMLTRETCVESVVTIKWRNWLILRHDQNGTRVAAMSKSVSQTVPILPPASSRQLPGASTHLIVESGNSDIA